MERKAMIIGLKADKIEEYKELHAAVWPSVIAQLERSNFRNFSIFLREPENLLFGYFEYHGTDFEADSALIAADPETQRWWTLTDPCQQPLASAGEGEQWSMMEEVFHMD